MDTRYKLLESDGAYPQGKTGKAWPVAVLSPPLHDEYTWLFQPDGDEKAYYVDCRELSRIIHLQRRTPICSGCKAIEILRDLLADLQDTGDDRNPESGKEYASCEAARKFLEKLPTV